MIFFMNIRIIISFQYILCFGSRGRRKSKSFVTIVVSIHPMFRFKEVPINGGFEVYNVSIHPMFRFKRIINVGCNCCFCVSIHPMFRFKFQYHQRALLMPLGFNTSYVSVQGYIGLYNYTYD